MITSFYENYVSPVVAWMFFSIPPGPQFIPFKYVINIQKGGTLPLCLFLMWYFNNYSFAAWLITALHGSYGLLWITKHYVFPDPHWDNCCTLPSALVMGSGLAGYWSAAYLTISNKNVQILPHQMCIAIFMYVFGVVLMMASDTQKYFVLKVKKGLISDGWFAKIRNTNYLGEMMLYGSFAFVAQHWLPMVIFASVWSIVFASRWVDKEKSIRKKAGGEKYMEQSALLLPLFAYPLVMAFLYYLAFYYIDKANIDYLVYLASSVILWVFKLIVDFLFGKAKTS